MGYGAVFYEGKTCFAYFFETARLTSRERFSRDSRDSRASRRQMSLPGKEAAEKHDGSFGRSGSPERALCEELWPQPDHRTRRLQSLLAAYSTSAHPHDR